MKQIEKQINDLQNKIDLLRVELEEKAKQNKIDFSILNDEDWFYIENMYGYLIRGNISLNGYELSFDNVYCIKTNTLRFNESMISDNITLLRKATPEDLKPLYKNHPELEPPKVGDLCVFWDDSITKQITYNYLRTRHWLYPMLAVVAVYQHKT